MSSFSFSKNSEEEYSKSSYNSDDLRVSDLDETNNFDHEEDIPFDFENDSLKRHFYQEYLNADADIKRLKLEIENVEHKKQDTLIDLTRQYNEICLKYRLYKEEQEKKREDYENTLILMETQRRNEEEEMNRKYNESFELLKTRVSYNEHTIHDLKQEMVEMKVENSKKIDQLSCAMADLDIEIQEYTQKESEYRARQIQLLSEQERLRALLDRARAENKEVNENCKRVLRKHDRVEREVQDLRLTSKLDDKDY